MPAEKYEALIEILNSGVITPADIVDARNESAPERRRELDRLHIAQHELVNAARKFLSAVKDADWNL